VTRLVDLSTVIAAAAALWALGFGWFTYVRSVQAENEDEFAALKSVVTALRAELDFMKDWALDPGYSKTLTREQAQEDHPDWSMPSRIIFRFSSDAIEGLSNSRYLYDLESLVEPFSRLKLSISKLFQLHDEYRAFANSNPNVLTSVPEWYAHRIFELNYQMHVGLIGGPDGNPDCLYRAYRDAGSALKKFDDHLKKKSVWGSWWYGVGHVIASLCLFAGGLLLFRAFRS